MADYVESDVTNNPELEQLLQALVDAVEGSAPDSTSTGYELIRNDLVQTAFEELNQTNIDTRSVVQLMESVIVPSALSFDKGWKDLPEGYDSTMNGVSVRAFVDFFDSVFVYTAVVTDLANQLNTDYDWKESEDLRKHVVNRLGSSEKIAALFYYAMACSVTMRYPIAIMTVDPCAGYLLSQWGFETLPQDGSFYKSSNLDGLSLQAGQSSSIQLPSDDNILYPLQWLSGIAITALPAGAGPNFTVQALAGREQWILSSTSPVESNPLGKFQLTWRERLLSDSDSHLATVVKINQEFNLNAGNLYNHDTRTEYYATLGEAYRQALSPLGYDIFAGGGYVELSDTPLSSTISTSQTTSTPSITSVTALPQLSNQLKIKPGGGGFLNDFGGSQVLINSDRIVLNTRTDYLMLFGGAGVSISSRQPINIDTDSTITVFGQDGLYLGLPNKGEPYDPNKPSTPNSNYFGVEAGPTANNETGYEPMVLGEKLADVLDDLLVTLINSTTLSPVGTGAFREDVIYNLKALRARLPEMLSTYAFIDGISHEPAGEFPSVPASLSQVGGVANNQVLKQISGIVGSTTTAGGGQQLSDPLSSIPEYYVGNVLYSDPI